jgi:hypothetical protein
LALCPLGTRGKGTLRMYPWGRVPTQNKGHLACTTHTQQQAAQLKKHQHHDPSGRHLPAASILMVSAIFLCCTMAHDICNMAIFFFV